MRWRSLILMFVLLVPSAAIARAESAAGMDFKVGEKVTYSIKKLGIKAGAATLTFNGPVKEGDRELVLITFTADGMNFFDEEKIFMDPENFYPVKVERDVNIFGKKEKISEEYDSKAGTVKITKLAGGKTTGQTIQKPGLLDNIYCFIYRYRRNGNFKLGDTLAINLPTQDIKITLTENTTVKAGGKVNQAYYMKSDPAKYQVWFDAGDRKVPLRINGAVGFGDTTMVMTEYKE